VTDLGLFYLGGIDLPMPQARAVQTLHTAHGLASLGARVLLAVGRAPPSCLDAVLADFGLQPHPGLAVLALPTLRLPRLPLRAYVHPRLAVWNWSYGLSAIAALLLLPARARPRLVLARDPRLAWLLLRARALTGADVVYEVHELFSSEARQSSTSREQCLTRKPRIRRMEEQVFAQARGLVTLTTPCRDLLVDQFGVDRGRVLVAPDAVACLPKCLPARDPRSRVIAYAGQLYPWKGVSTLVAALAHLPDSRLRLIGGLGNDDPHTAQIVRQARELGVFARIDFKGYLPHRAVPGALAGAAVAAVPLPDNPMARLFTSPLKLYEYIAAGLPIVASDLPALRDLLVDKQNALLVPPDQPMALARALGRVLDHPELGERLRERALSDLRGWTWRERAAKLLAFMRDL
jgi:glycosyltransferase involved in cell wall biosynthesis